MEKNNTIEKSASLLLKARPERKLIRASGSKRYVDFFLQVEQIQPETRPARPPLKLALVLDRSGSMQGEKLGMAKKATLGVLDQLTPHDRVAVIVFDSHIDVIQKLAPVTAELKSQVRRALENVEARASTALHEGWLNGCNAITTEQGVTDENTLARCFLLTDGIANVGVTDPERIASEAAGVRDHTGISTSTFGIGNEYNELLLGPMAVAGGGQFHHLRTSDEIAQTFVGELGGLLAVAARQVRLEIEMESGVQADLVSAYWENNAAGSVTRRAISIGDLQGGEERHLVIQFGFPEQEQQELRTIRARLVWQSAGREVATDWQELRFLYASNSACDDEPQNAEVMHQVGLQEIDRARREAVQHNNSGNLQAARDRLAGTAQMVSSYSDDDTELQEELKQLQVLHRTIAAAPMAPAMAKEVYYGQQSRSRNQKDLRKPGKKLPGEDKKK
jgi:Ca-activated chloride channel family protein